MVTALAENNSLSTGLAPIAIAWLEIEKIRRSPLNHRTIFVGIKASEPTQYGTKGWGENLLSAQKVFGFDLGKIQKKIETDLKAKKAEKAGKKPKKVEAPVVRDDGKRCGLVNGKNGTHGCIHEQGHEGLHSNGVQTWRDRPAKKGGK